MKRAELVSYLDEYLRIADIQDYGPQGLQVETENSEIAKVALAVDTAPAVIESAAEWSADLLVVHHGILWRSVEPVAGPLGRRVRLLMRHGLNLYAAHLALDAHPAVGNNAVLAQMLNVQVEDWWCDVSGTPIGVSGSLPEALEPGQLASKVEDRLATRVRLLPHGAKLVRKVAIVSGFGADRIAEASALGADIFLTGESSHVNYWAASDYEINVIYAGHYATETVGVKALGRHLEEEFGLDTKFIDFPTDM